MKVTRTIDGGEPEALELDLGYDDGEDNDCATCGGDGFAECDGDCWESDDCGCPYAGGHSIRCPNCKGSGLAADQHYW